MNEGVCASSSLCFATVSMPTEATSVALLFRFVWCGIGWCGIGLCVMVWYGVVLCGMIQYGTV